MGVTKQEKTVTVEKRSGSSETSATVTENGKSGSAKGGTVEQALAAPRTRRRADCFHR
ncbi:MAG: hypothetical protein QOJ84_5329 [Bradyrhizobium sp.]|jgi:hypothetical protein|nr:hypothetical protein [Bradyrhizobium sp.]